MPRWTHGLVAVVLLASAALAPACRSGEPAATPTPEPEEVGELAVVWEAWSVLTGLYVGDGPEGPLDRQRLVDEAIDSMLAVAGIEPDGFLEELAQMDGTPPSSVPEGLEDIWRAWQLLVERDEELQGEELAYAAVRGIVGGVNDRYTQFLDPAEYQQQRATLEGHYEGIGVVVAEEPLGMLIVSVFPGSPAELVGLQPGDVITKADGEPLRGLSTGEAAGQLRGPQGTTVEVTVERPNEGEMTFSVVRGAIDMPTVDYEFVGEGIAYLRIRQFSRHTPDEVQEAISELRRAGGRAIVIDLRGNPGGSLTAAIAVASEFLSQGLVMYAIDRDGVRTEHSVAEGGTARTEDLAVLIDGTTASAAEVVAAALQDHGRATLFGRTTFGKGSVTTVRRLSDGSVIRISSSHWFTPSGNEIQGQGVRPDVSVPLFLEDLIARRDRALLLALDHLHEQLHGRPSVDDAAPVDATDPIEIPPPAGGPTEVWERAVELFHQAVALQFAGRLSEAVETYQRSIGSHPTAEAHTFLAWTYSWMGRLEDAIDEARKAIDVDPAYGNPYNDIGLYLIALGRTDEAIPWLEQAMEAPRYAEPQFPYVNMGRVRVSRGEWEAAFESFLTAWELRPDAMDARFPTGSLAQWLPAPERRSAPSTDEAAAVAAALEAFADGWSRYDAEALLSTATEHHAEALLLRLAWAKYTETPLTVMDVEPLHLEDDTAVARARVEEGDLSRVLHYLLTHTDEGWMVVMALR